jgi:hypothetical protein
MDEFGIPGMGIYDPTGSFGGMSSMREAEARASSQSQVPGTSAAPFYTPSSMPGGVSTGNGTGTSARTRFKTLIYRKGFGAGACGALVSTSKVLAQMNKT